MFSSISYSGERKHCCTTCGKLFLKNDHLKRHERTHSSERPFACEQCGKTFRDKDHLKVHILAVFPKNQSIFQYAYIVGPIFDSLNCGKHMND